MEMTVRLPCWSTLKTPLNATLANLGMGEWTIMPNLAHTYLWEKRGLEFDNFVGFDIYSQNSTTKYTSGTMFHWDGMVIQNVQIARSRIWAKTLGQFLNLVQYANGALVPPIDVATHSMGGLITRAYLSGLQANGSLVPPANPRIRKLVFIAEPNFGSFIATNIGTQTAEMIPGSPLLWELATSKL
jgi:pimeloyl-ACP methyl ester carboxylesterase